MKSQTKSKGFALSIICGLLFSGLAILSTPAASAADGDLGSLDFASAQTKYLEYNSASSAFAFGTGEFTIEYWWKPTANRRSDVMDFWSDPGAGSAQTTRLIIGTFGGAPQVYVDDKLRGSGVKISASSNLALNTWNHVAVTRASGAVKLWVNGTQAGSTYSNSLDFGNVGMKLSIMKDHGAGANGSGKFTGARVVLGSAIYTSTFTPPSSALEYRSGTTFLLNTFQGASNYLRDSSATNMTFSSLDFPTSSNDTPLAPSAITLAPNISSISAATGSTLGGRSVRISGTYLTNTSQITFGGVAATSIVVESATSVLATTPASTLGAKNVVLTTASGATTLQNGFTYISTLTPTINSLSITEGTTAGGTSTVITGTNLETATSVTVDGNPATIVSNSSTSISITTPAGSEGAKSVVVNTAGGSATNVGAFTYNTRFTVSYSGGVGTTGTAPVQASIAPNETFTVASGSTISKAGYTFSKWKDAGNVEYLPGASYTVTNATVTLTAQWTLNNYVVTFLAGSNGSISGTTPQNIDHGTSTSQITAVPNANYHFTNWSDASTVNPRAISSVETTTSLTATFAIDTYTATYNSGGNGSISGALIQTVNHGESATAVTATPSANYHFVSWNDGVLTATRLDAAITGSISKTASFAIDAHAITFNANGGSGGSTVSVNYNENAVASAPTVSRSQYTFAGWAETVTASSIATWTVVGPKTLYSLWTPKIYSITYNAESGTALTVIETFTVGSAPIQLQTATRAGYKFNGWYTDRTGGSLLGITGANYTPSDTATVHAQWTQASLVGLSSPTSFGTIIATSGNDGGISATRSGTKAEIDYFADSLPDNTVITAYLQGSTAYAASQLTGVTNLLLSVVVAWKAPDETVPVVDSAKSAIRLKITNEGIKRGAKVYSIAGDSSTILTTATQDGFVVIELREDPEIVIANPVEVPAPPTPPAPTPASITAAPIVDNSAAENAAKLKAQEEVKKAAELKAAQEQAAKDLQAARDKAEAEIKAAQDTADSEAKLKAEADARLAAELKAKEDAEIAARLAAQKIVPDVTLYSISPTLKLSVYDATYLKNYVATLKPKATVTCIGYIYPKNTTLAKAKLKATSQATAICKLIKAQRKTLTTKIVVYPASKAPKAAAGAKWVAVSYRVDGYKS
ncbi:Listeria/Bacterioides repeat [Candidatus Nanopelagicaceae bacterium]